jgi:serine/threonine protein kinase
MAAADIDRNLLFGVIALQDDLIGEKQFTEGCHGWALRLERPLADLLMERRWITEEDRREIERKIERKIKKHGNVRASLAAVAGPDARDLIRSVDHPEIRTSLSSLPPAAGHVLLETVVPPHQPESSRYTLTRSHAEGGLGRVWLARDRELHRGVALKEIKPDRAENPELWRRFLKEAQITGQLEHPNIVPVYDLARRREDDQPFYTMRFVRGQPLLGAIKEFHRERAGKAPERLALHSLLGAFLKVCDAIAYAHSRGVVHRDLKPENIVLGGYGEVVVLDWGLAKMVDAVEIEEAGAQNAETNERISLGPEARTDKTHGVLGTPCYMAPEQVEGKRDQIDGRTDVYALGGILFEILTGHAPAEGTTTADVLEKIRTGRIPRAREVEPTAPAALEAICAKAMAVERSKRYAKAPDLAAEVRRWIADEPVSAYREPLVARARRWMRRHHTLTTAAAAAMFMCLAALAALYQQTAAYSASLALINHSLDEANGRLVQANKELEVRNKELDHERNRAEEREGLAIDAVKRFRNVVVEEPVLKSNPALEALRKKLLKEPLAFFKSLRKQLQADNETRPEALARLATAAYEYARLSQEIGDIQDSLRSCVESLAIWERLVRDHPAKTKYQSGLAQIESCRGNMLSDTGRPDEALQSYGKALAIFERLAGENPSVTKFKSDLAESHNDIGILHKQTGHPDQALESYRKALAIRERLARENPSVTGFQSDLADSNYHIGLLQSDTGHPDRALESYGKALEVQERLVRENPGVTEFQRYQAAIHHNIGILQHETGHPDQALESYGKALAVEERLASENPSVTEIQSRLATCHGNIGLLQSQMGRPDQALESYGKALAIRERLARENPSVTRFQSDVAASHNDIGNHHGQAGHPDQALVSNGKALAIRERLAREHPETPDHASELGGTLNNIATIGIAARRFDQARDKLRQAISWQKKALATNPRHPTYRRYLGRHLSNLIKAATALGNAGEAAAAQRELAELDASDPAMQALDVRLAAVNGGESPKDNGERLQLAYRAYEKKQLVASARLFAEALVADPKLADDRRSQHRYNAACAAALAAASAKTALTPPATRGIADKPPNEADPAKLRYQARAWLEAELKSWSRLLESAKSEQRLAIAGTLKHWQEDTDLAGVRDEAALANLPKKEREEWNSLWADVDALIRKPRIP